MLEQKYLEQIHCNDELKQILMQRTDGSFNGEALILQQQVKNLEEKLEESYRSQHHLENLCEEYEVNLKRVEENLK